MHRMLTTHLKKTAALKDGVDRYHGGPQEQRVCSLNDRCEAFHADAAEKPKTIFSFSPRMKRSSAEL